jgi:hypothetical protein
MFNGGDVVIQLRMGDWPWESPAFTGDEPQAPEGAVPQGPPAC